jgi:hypothetical protein
LNFFEKLSNLLCDSRPLVLHEKNLTQWVQKMIRKSEVENQSQIDTSTTDGPHATLVMRFLQLIDEFDKLNNFNGMVAVWNAISNAPDFTLKKLSKIKKKYSKRFHQNNNYSQYRQELAICGVPCVPYAQVIEDDLVNLFDTELVSVNFVNFERFRSISTVVTTIRHLQIEYSSIIPIKQFQDWINDTFHNSKQSDESILNPIPSMVSSPLTSVPTSQTYNKIRSLSETNSSNKGAGVGFLSYVESAHIVPVPNALTQRMTFEDMV